jgi:hypothetical protein
MPPMNRSAYVPTIESDDQLTLVLIAVSTTTGKSWLGRWRAAVGATLIRGTDEIRTNGSRWIALVLTTRQSTAGSFDNSRAATTGELHKFFLIFEK